MWFQFEIFEKSILTFMSCKISSGAMAIKISVAYNGQSNPLAGWWLEQVFIFPYIGNNNQ